MKDRLRSSIEAAADILKAFGAREVYVFGSAAHGSLRQTPMSIWPSPVFHRQYFSAQRVKPQTH
jgi:hypothetical protein